MAFGPDVAAALDRLANFYNSGGYDPQSNPGGLANGGHRLRFTPSLADVALVVNAIGDLQAQIVQGTVSAKALSDVLNRVGRRAIADQNATVAATDSYVAFTSLTVARTLALPPAASFAPFPPLYVADESGACSFDAGRTITVAASGSDTVAGQPIITMVSPYQKLVLHSNGSNLWTFA